MAAYRLTDPAPVFPNLLGTARAANGSLTFYEKGTTMLKDTWSDQALTIDNDNPVPLDSSGRAETEIWLDGEYTVVAKAADGSPIWTRVVAPEIAPGLAIPDLTGKTGWFLSNNGSVLVWQDILALLLPDPTGSAGFQVVVNADGTGYVLQPIEDPDIPSPDIVVTATSFQAGTTDNTSKYLQQVGSDSAPASGTKTTTKVTTFATPFTTIPVVMVQPTVAAVGSGGFLVCCSVIATTETNFTVKFDVNEGAGGSSASNIINPVTYNYVAHGRKTVT